MAEDDDEPRRPTLDDLLAILASLKGLEATTRAAEAPGASIDRYTLRAGFMARDAWFTLGIVYNASKLDRYDGGAGFVEHQAFSAAILATDAAFDPPGMIPVDPGHPSYSADERARLVAAIDTLAAAVDLAEALERMPTEERERIEEATRRGRPPMDDRNEAIRQAKQDNPRMKAGEIARMLAEEAKEKGWGKINANIVRDHWKAEAAD